jgi:hypothetical protein
VGLRTTVCGRKLTTTPTNVCSLKTNEPRSCPGQYVADASVWIVLATMLSTLKICKAKDENGQEIIPEVKFEVGLTAYVACSHLIVRLLIRFYSIYPCDMLLYHAAIPRNLNV